jgi:hypothetical protein
MRTWYEWGVSRAATEQLVKWMTSHDPVDERERESIATFISVVPVRHETEGGLLFHVDVHPGPKGHTHLDLRYLLRAPQVTPRPADGESSQVGWFAWEEAGAMADAGLAGALRAARALLGKA